MSNLFKRSIGFTAAQMAWLKGEARKLEISIADLIRRIIDEYRNR